MTGLKKSCLPQLTHSGRIALIENDNPALSIARQAALLGVSRSSIYYAPRVSETNLACLRALDELYTKYPFYGSRRMRFALRDEYGITICREHAQRLMRTLGLAAIYPKRATSKPAPGHRIYSYLLSNLPVVRPNHVWSSDITCVRLGQGYCYLTVIMDWYSRYVIGWELSDTLEAAFCVRALAGALSRALPEIHNSDQGAQYTSDEYTGMLTARGIKISMDGRGRYPDNIFTERLWRTVKYEDIYLKQYRAIGEARSGLAAYFPFYNENRRHQALGYKTPAEVYYGRN